MALYLVGENIDKSRSHYLAETGKLVQLMRGIYVDADDDIDAIVLRHAVRIAHYLYSKAYLSAASAILMGPTRDGRLFLSGRRSQRTRIRALEIIQNEAPKSPSLGIAIVDDGMGEFQIDVSAIRQRFLEAFRMRSEHAASINDDARAAIAARLIEEYGSTKLTADAVWALARENEWYKEGEQAERFLLRSPTSIPVRNEAAFNLVIAWHGTPIGNLTHDGFEWRWISGSTEGPFIVRQTTPGKLPPFIISLLPEGWLEHVLQDRDERAMLKSGKRYMSNIAIVEDEGDLLVLTPDVLVSPLSKFSSNGFFTGNYVGPGRGEIEESFERNLAQIYEHSETPRLSGIQIKAPMYLDQSGTLSPSIGMPFTHILKPAGTSGFEPLPVIEWMALMLGKVVGFEVPSVALVTMPSKMPPALLVERFDIRNNAIDTRRFALEDLCSVLNLPTEAKYDGTIERVARAVRSLSTSPDEDIQLILRRALFAWLIADGDMHLKNMAMLKISEPGETRFSSVRIAPLYDAVTTRVFSRLEKDRMALKLNGKDDNLRRADFRTLAITVGIRSSDADQIIDSTIELLKNAIDQIALPKPLILNKEATAMATRMLEICRQRSNNFD